MPDLGTTGRPAAPDVAGQATPAGTIGDAGSRNGTAEALTDLQSGRRQVPTVPGVLRIRAARFQPMLVVGLSLAYLPTALGAGRDRPLLPVALALMAGLGLWAWRWGRRATSDHRRTDRAALLLALLGFGAFAIMVRVATPETAPRLLTVAVLLLAVGALFPVRSLRWILQACTVALGLTVAMLWSAPVSELALVALLLVAVAWTANAFAGDLVTARRAHRSARTRARRQAALLLAVQDLPRDDLPRARAEIVALLASHGLVVEPGTGAQLAVQRVDGAASTPTDRALVEVLTAHLRSIRDNVGRVARQHELLQRLSRLERTRTSFLDTVCDDLDTAVATVQRSIRALTADDGPDPGEPTPTDRPPPESLEALVGAARTLNLTIEAMFALAQSYRVDDGGARSVTRDELAEVLRSDGVSVRVVGADTRVLADPHLVGQAARLWVMPPALLVLTTTRTGVVVIREPSGDAEVERALIGRLLTAAGGRWLDGSRVGLAAAGSEERPWA